MTNFVTCCKFVPKGISKQETSVHDFTSEEFSRLLGNIYAQSWLKPEPVHVTIDTRPELQKFLKSIAKNINTAKITFEADERKEQLEIKPKIKKKLESDSEADKTELYVRSKTQKSMQSILVVTDYSTKPKRQKLSEEGDADELEGAREKSPSIEVKEELLESEENETAENGDSNSCNKLSNDDVSEGATGKINGHNDADVSTLSVTAATKNEEKADNDDVTTNEVPIPSEELLEDNSEPHIGTSKEPCDDAMHANVGQDTIQKEVKVVDDARASKSPKAEKEKKHKSKKHKKEKRKDKKEKEKRKGSPVTKESEKGKSKTGSKDVKNESKTGSKDVKSETKTSSKEVKKEPKCEKANTVRSSSVLATYDPLDPAPTRHAFPLPAGMDEGEIVSDRSDNEQEQQVSADLSSFVETSPDQFASIVSSINKFYSTAVVEQDEFLNLDVATDPNSDEEELDLNEQDNLLITGKVESEGDVCGLDIYLYNRQEEELFVHHDYFLPAFPLALEWLDYNGQAPSKKGNMVAVGSVKSEIEIWPVDQIGPIQPQFKLGAPRGILQNNRIAETLSGHSAAVTSLSWNSIIRKGLASGSVDSSVAFWDLEKGDCLAVFNHHQAEVSSVAFHPVEPYLLATGGFDKKVTLLDLSTQEASCNWTLSANIEAILWSTLSVNQLYAAQSNGNIAAIDLRFTEQVLFEYKAHEKGVTAIVEDRFYPGCLVSVSEDSHLKLWNLTDYIPICVKDKNMKMGHLSCVDSCYKSPFVYAVGGQSSGIRVVDFSNKAMSQFVDNTEGCEDW